MLLTAAVLGLGVSIPTVRLGHRLQRDYRRLRRPYLVSLVYAGMPPGSARYARRTRREALRLSWERNTR